MLIFQFRIGILYFNNRLTSSSRLSFEKYPNAASDFVSSTLVFIASLRDQLLEFPQLISSTSPKMAVTNLDFTSSSLRLLSFPERVQQSIQIWSRVSHSVTENTGFEKYCSVGRGFVSKKFVEAWQNI